MMIRFVYVVECFEKLQRQCVSYYPRSIISQRQRVFNFSKDTKLNMQEDVPQEVESKIISTLVPVIVCLNETSDRQFSEKSASEYREKIPDIHSHDSQHTWKPCEQSMRIRSKERKTHSKYDTPAIHRNRHARGRSTLNRQGIGPRDML
jgi:hypothetical protein